MIVKPNLSTLAGILALMMLAVLYVLSIGPVYHFYLLPSVNKPGDFARAQPLYQSFYAPVAWLCGKSSKAASTLDWYVDLWKRPER